MRGSRKNFLSVPILAIYDKLTKANRQPLLFMLPKQMNRRIGRAMHDYSMLSDGDRLVIAVSGGMDSLFLAWLLVEWRKKAPISFSVEAVHVDMDGTDSDASANALRVRHELASYNISLTILPAAWKPTKQMLEQGDKNICFRCARARRTQLFDYCRKNRKNKLALGHHKDDIIETFLLNITCAGNISTMKPKQDLFDKDLCIVRPLAYCEKHEVDQAGSMLDFAPVHSSCPLSELTRRKDIHQVAQSIYAKIPGAKKNIFAAMANVRAEYLLQIPDKE